MIALLDRADRSGLVAYIAGALTVVILLSALIFGLAGKGEGRSPYPPVFVPPPIVIGIVWLALFPGMAIARWELNRATAMRADKAGLMAVFALCSTYPLHTGGLNNDVVGEAADVSLTLRAGGLAARYAAGSHAPARGSCRWCAS